MSRGRPAALAAAGLALAAATAALLSPDPGAVLVAVSAEEVASLASRSPAGTSGLWERLKAMGLSGAVLREETLADLAGRGELLHVTRAEAEKWRALGLVSQGSAVRGDALWAKDARGLTRAAEALAARGVEFSTASAGPMRALLLPPGFDPGPVPAGFDPAAVSALSEARLLPVAAPAGSAAMVARARFWTRTLPVDASAASLRRAVFSRERRLIVLRLRTESGLEENLALLREALRRVRACGRPSEPPVPAPAPEPGALRVAAFFLLGLLGPLLAARCALTAARASRPLVCGHLSQASPVPQAALGALASWAAASGAGFLAAALLPSDAREGLARVTMVWVYGAPAAVGAAALYFGEGAAALPGWRASLRVRHLAVLAAAAAAAALLLSPRAALGAAGLWEALARLGSAADRLWWWPWRWREALVGAPCLLVALSLIETAPPGKAEGFADPRGWLVLGLLAPSGAMLAAASTGVPPAAALGHGLAALLIGGALAAAAAALRAPKSHPREDRESQDA